MSGSKLAALAAILGLAVAGCSSGANGTSSVNPGGPPVPAPAQAAAAHDQALAADPDGKKNQANNNGVNAVNALGSPVKTYTDENTNEPGSNAEPADAMSPRHSGNGTCRWGIEFYAPDRNNDPNSTETLNFFDPGCTQLARDIVRKWTAGSVATTETVTRTVNEFAAGNSTPIGVRTDNTTITNGTFGKNGFPIVASGFQRETSSQLVVGTSKNVLSDSETVMEPSTSLVNNYCTDTAGYNSLSISKLDLTFGWQGGAFQPGTRTQNSDGSVTWSATHIGQTESAPQGTFGIATGTANTVCPIVTPAYTLTGGTTKGNYNIPIAITFKYGVIRNLVVTNAALSSGDTLNVSTNTNRWPANQYFIKGIVTNGGSSVATFNVNAYGNGTLTITKTGNQFPITDWNVVR